MAFAAVLADFSFVAFGVLQYTEQGLVLLVVCQGATRSARLSLKMLRKAGLWARKAIYFYGFRCDSGQLFVCGLRSSSI